MVRPQLYFYTFLNKYSEGQLVPILFTNGISLCEQNTNAFILCNKKKQ